MILASPGWFVPLNLWIAMLQNGLLISDRDFTEFSVDEKEKGGVGIMQCSGDMNHVLTPLDPTTEPAR